MNIGTKKHAPSNRPGEYTRSVVTFAGHGTHLFRPATAEDDCHAPISAVVDRSPGRTHELCTIYVRTAY